MWFIGVEVEQETSAPPPKKNPGSAPESGRVIASRRFEAKRKEALVTKKARTTKTSKEEWV